MSALATDSLIAVVGIRAQLVKIAENGRLTAADALVARLAAAYGEDRYRISPLLHQKVFAGRKFHD